MPRVDGVQVPTKLDGTTNKQWGSGVAVSVLKSAIASKEADFSRMMDSQSYNQASMKQCLQGLGEFYRALGLHFLVQAARQSDGDHEVRIIRRFNDGSAVIQE